MSEPDFQVFAAPLFNVAPSDRAVSRAYVEEGLCPVCGAGPFAVVALHTQRKHGLDRYALREMLGVYKTTSICDEGHSAALRLASKRAFTAEKAEKMAKGRRRGQQPRQLSEAAKERNRSQARASRDVAVAALKASVRQRSEQTRERDELMREHWNAGASMAEIAERFGVTVKSVRQGFLRLGMQIGTEGRKRSAASATAKSLALIKERRKQRASERARERVAQFVRLGADWTAVQAMAAAEGVAEKTMRAALRAAGAVVPDGRRVRHK